MNKQQLASKIWTSANKMRSNIEASEYKDYILGFIFYKFLSEKEEKWLLKNDWERADFKDGLVEEDEETVSYIKRNIGYFISYENLFSTWLSLKKDFDIQKVKDALSAFARNIHEDFKSVYDDIFVTLDTGLSKLGTNALAQTKAVRDLIDLIKDIPMDENQDYDVLGFIYEFLISNFAANAGKKAGEFYTPHEVSMLMSEIIAHSLKDKKEIKIYDPTSGSGSLLINIGKAVSKHLNDPNNIKYYAQELKTATYNLTRMNLIMRGILPTSIITRCGDTLAEDWPISDANHNFEPLLVDAVVSNPPYSQGWKPEDNIGDARFEEYGYAPKSKADYAFLLHDLYHLKSDGIMTIVMPHGVLFRGGVEEKIRRNLIEGNKIYAIIGLPSNIFFGTSIPTIVMVLKKHRNSSDILFIDASKHFVKDGKNNKLQQSDIKRIVDAYLNREDIENFCRLVSKKEIFKNDYNLNISKYVDSSDSPEKNDIYSTMYGGIPVSEIEDMHKYWSEFPSLKDELFDFDSGEHSIKLKTSNIKDTVLSNKDVQCFVSKYKSNFENFDKYLENIFFKDMADYNVLAIENDIANNIFDKIKEFPIIDKYEMYQNLDDIYKQISIDLEMIKSEGKECINKVDPRMLIKKKNNVEVEYQDGFEGHILPFSLIKEYYFNAESLLEQKLDNKLTSISISIDEIFDSLSEEDKDVKFKEDSILNKDCDGFCNSVVKSYAKYLLKSKEVYEEDSIEHKIINVRELLANESKARKELKTLKIKLDADIKRKIESLTYAECLKTLTIKWIKPILDSIDKTIEFLVEDIITATENLSNKYKITMCDIENDIKDVSKHLAEEIEELTGNEYDMKGLKELQKILRGNDDE